VCSGWVHIITHIHYGQPTGEACAVVRPSPLAPSSKRCAFARRPLLGVVSETWRPGPPLPLVPTTTAACCWSSSSGDGVSGTVSCIGLYGVLRAPDTCIQPYRCFHLNVLQQCHA
jgi:hypothetical protein